MGTMMKEEVIQLVERMPDNCTLDDILYEMYFKQKVDKGLRDIEEGRVVSHEEVTQRVAKWPR